MDGTTVLKLCVRLRDLITFNTVVQLSTEGRLVKIAAERGWCEDYRVDTLKGFTDGTQGSL